MRAATEGSLRPVKPQGNLVEVLGREVRQGSPGELMVESTPSRQRRPPCKTNKEMAAARLLCEKALAGLSQECAIILGDYNAVTHPSHTTALRAPMWPWLVAKERAGTLVDLLTPHHDSVPYTRVRRYGGTKCYIDRAYGCRLFSGPL